MADIFQKHYPTGTRFDKYFSPYASPRMTNDRIISSRQFLWTLNDVNPSFGFRDIPVHSRKYGPHWYQICQVFGSWACPHGANGQLTMTMHNCRTRHFHKISNGVNPSNVLRNMDTAKSGTNRPHRAGWQYPCSREARHYFTLFTTSS